MSSIVKIARNELIKIVKNPLVILISVILFFVATLNGLASASTLPIFESLLDGNDHFLSVGISNTFYTTSLLMSILSGSIGLLSITEDRSNGSLNLLLTKPLYRRDYIIGKWTGLSVFIVLLILIDVLLSTSMIMLCYNGPTSGEELIIRLLAYVFILSVLCIEVMGIAMLISILFKNLFQALTVFGTLLCFEWLFNFPATILNLIGDLKTIFPVTLYITIISGKGNINLFDTYGPFSMWLNNILPYAFFMFLLTVLIFLFSSYLFNTQE